MRGIHYLNVDTARDHPSRLKLVTLVFIIIILFFLIPGAVLSGDEKPIRISADRLMTEYQNNESLADTRYKGKLLAVTGIVINVGKELGDIAYVALVTDDIILKIQCFLKKKNDAAFSRLGSGVRVTVFGWCDGKINEGNIVLKNCALKAHMQKTQEAVIGYCNLGNTYHGLGDYQQAIEDFDRAIELDPECAAAFWGRGRTYHELGNNQQAIEDFGRAIELNPKLEVAYWDRGKIYKELGNHQQAIEDWKKAAKLGHEGAKETLRSKKIKW